MSFSVAEVAELAARSDEISAVAGELQLTKASAFADRALLTPIFGELSRAVLELAAARRSAAGKFPETWLTDTDAAQQATPARVAAVRADRLRRAGVEFVHDVTCSVGTEAVAVGEAGMAWLGSDLDPARLLMARHNLGPGAWLARADALVPVTSPAASKNMRTAVVADPARRAGGRRITDPAKLLPPLPDLVQAQSGRELAVKCAPGIDYSSWEGLVSIVSVDGGVKEACLYTPGLSEGLAREAVVVGGFTERITSQENDDVDVTGAQEYIIEPDGAVVRAGLVRHWAHRHNLSMLDEHIAFLTGPTIPPGHSGFPFLEEVPLKQLKAALKTRGIGAAEILVRGVDVDPDVLRKKLKLSGGGQAAVVIARVGNGATAYVCGPRVWAPVAQ
ncbi:THUMP-like domain-containing protein [Corynebacterium sp.]|uniref:THUMP-like domain-containing protein n=1 Tax=Corynebacterium sp. TaxID=1720 RepID=UPI002A920DB4|nr:SAM-dependent methyltransferase [Corynebacterium sp.]MDY5784748.1 SAM-dependent methyltransferase [Corynebacterium sp.]